MGEFSVVKIKGGKILLNSLWYKIPGSQRHIPTQNIDMMSYCPINNRNLDSSCECLGARKYLCTGQPRSVREVVNGEEKSDVTLPW